MYWTLQQLHIWGWEEDMLKEMYIQTCLAGDVINSRPGVCQSARAKDCEIQFYNAWQEPERGNHSCETPLAPDTVLWEPRRDPGYGLSTFSFFWIQGAFPLFPCTGALMEDSWIVHVFLLCLLENPNTTIYIGHTEEVLHVHPILLSLPEGLKHSWWLETDGEGQVNPETATVRSPDSGFISLIAQLWKHIVSARGCGHRERDFD